MLEMIVDSRLVRHGVSGQPSLLPVSEDGVGQRSVFSQEARAGAVQPLLTRAATTHVADDLTVQDFDAADQLASVHISAAAARSALPQRRAAARQLGADVVLTLRALVCGTRALPADWRQARPCCARLAC